MNLLPLFLKLEGRRGLVAGAGPVALEKIHNLLPTGIALRVVAPEAIAEIRALAEAGELEFIERPFEESDLDGMYVALAATNNPEVNGALYRAATSRGILANSADDPPNCDFYFGSVVRRGQLQIAISTSGASPAVAQRLRREVDEQLPEDLGPWLEEIGSLRRQILASRPPGEGRKILLHQLVDRPLCNAGSCPTRIHALTQSESSCSRHARVSLVGAGAGDPELLTLKAARLLGRAQVVLHDDLVPTQILAMVSAGAEIINVGKRCGTKRVTQEEIHELMIDRVSKGLEVVRLKSGDPLLFGRAAEEMKALERAGIDFEIVPGVSAAFAAATTVGASLTSRSTASKLLISTGRQAPARDSQQDHESSDTTRVVYMPGRDLGELAGSLLAEGLSGETPCAVVSRASQPDERIVYSSLEKLAEVEMPEAPSIAIAGWALWESAKVRADLLRQAGQLATS